MGQVTRHPCIYVDSRGRHRTTRNGWILEKTNDPYPAGFKTKRQALRALARLQGTK